MTPGRTLLGLNIGLLNAEQLSRSVEECLIASRGGLFVGIYASLFFKFRNEPAYWRILTSSAELYPDGKGVEAGIRMLGLDSASECSRIATTDFWPELVRLAIRHDREIFLIGGIQSSLDATARSIRLRGGDVAATESGFPLKPYQPESPLGRQISASRNPIVMVGLGSGSQEEYARALISSAGPSGGPIVFTVGGLFDHIAGTTRRAPRWVQRAGLEWLWRVAQEPRRLAGRYFLGNAYYSYKLLRAAIGEGRGVSARRPPSRHSAG